VNLPSKMVFAALLTLVASLAGLTGCALTDGLPKGAVAPELSVTAWVNTSTATTSIAGNRGKHVLVEFWSMHCRHCRDKIPEMRQITAQYCCKDLEVLSVHVPLGDHEDTAATVAAFAQKEQLPFPVGIDPTGHTLEHFQFGYLPHACLIGPDGRVVWAGSLSMYDAEDHIREALGGGDAGSVGAVSVNEFDRGCAKCGTPDCACSFE